MSTPLTTSTNSTPSPGKAPHSTARDAVPAPPQSRTRRAAKEASPARTAPKRASGASASASAETVPSDVVAGPETGAKDDDGVRLEWIAVSAYFLGERRGFVDGSPDEDWLQAEREVDLMFAMRDAAGLPASS